MDERQKLIIEQVDMKLYKFKQLDNMVIPPKGWIYTIRTAMKMSLRQLGTRLKITAQSVKEIEEREENGSLTLKLLREAGAALDMKLIYGFIPMDESIEKIIDNRAMQIAKEIVSRTSHTMKLEDQEVRKERLEKAIQSKANEIKNKMPKYLWD